MKNTDKSKRGKEIIKLSGAPQKKQEEFFLADTRYIAYGGARGGGKSWALRRKLVLMCLKYPGISVLLIRRTYAQLRDNHIRVLIGELKEIAQYTDTRKSFEFPNGSVLRMGYLDSESDAAQYQGQEYDVIALDEATQLSEYQFQKLKGSLRGANDFPKRFYLTCNPGGVGHAWVKRLFIDRNYRAGEKAEDYTFIPAKVYDNEILLKKDPGYLEQLESLPGTLKNAWLGGSWDEFEGQFFPEFDVALHTSEMHEPDPHGVRYCAMDYGLDMLACVFVCVSPDGSAEVYDEINVPGKIVSEAAKLIKLKNSGVVQYIAPSDLWSRQKDSGKSVAELFGENGIYLTKLTCDRISGWLALREMLKPVINGDGTKTAKLKIMQNCTELIRCMGLLLHDTMRPGDAAVKPHSITHLPDALRYFVVSKSVYSPSESKDGHIKLTEKLKSKNKRKAAD